MYLTTLASRLGISLNLTPSPNEMSAIRKLNLKYALNVAEGKCSCLAYQCIMRFIISKCINAGSRNNVVAVDADGVIGMLSSHGKEIEKHFLCSPPHLDHV